MRRGKTLSLRASLTAWFVGLASLVLVGTSLALYLGVRKSLLLGIDGALQAQAKDIAALCEWEDGAVHLEGAYETAPQLPLFHNDRAVEIRLLPGLQLVQAFGAALPNLPDNSTRSEWIGSHTLDGDLRSFAIVVDFPARPGTGRANETGELGPSPAFSVLIRVATSLRPMHHQLLRIASTIGVIGLFSIAAVVAFGAFLSRRVTVPLARLKEAAVRVRDGEVAHLPQRGTGDEIDRLAGILDQAFAALRSSVDQQKRFIADASHELRNPISILQSTSEIALRRERDPGDYAKALGEVHDVARRMARLVESLLMLTRLDADGHSAPAAVDLVSVVHECVGVEAEQSGKTIEVTAPPTANVTGDRHLLGMLCSNLLNNAMRHARRRVVVEIAVEASTIVLRVADDGPGVPPQDRNKLFERFYRGENTNGHAGAGLGLALVAAIAAAHDARWGLGSEPGPGGLVVEIVFGAVATTA